MSNVQSLVFLSILQPTITTSLHNLQQFQVQKITIITSNKKNNTNKLEYLD